MDALKHWKTAVAGILVAGGTLVKMFFPKYATSADLVIGAAVAAGLLSAADASLVTTKGPEPPKP